VTLTGIVQQTISTETALAELLLKVLSEQDRLKTKLEIVQAENAELKQRLARAETQ